MSSKGTPRRLRSAPPRHLDGFAALARRREQDHGSHRVGPLAVILRNSQEQVALEARRGAGATGCAGGRRCVHEAEVDGRRRGSRRRQKATAANFVVAAFVSAATTSSSALVAIGTSRRTTAALPSAAALVCEPAAAARARARLRHRPAWIPRSRARAGARGRAPRRRSPPAGGRDAGRWRSLRVRAVARGKPGRSATGVEVGAVHRRPAVEATRVTTASAPSAPPGLTRPRPSSGQASFVSQLGERRPLHAEQPPRSSATRRRSSSAAARVAPTIRTSRPRRWRREVRARRPDGRPADGEWKT